MVNVMGGNDGKGFQVSGFSRLKGGMCKCRFKDGEVKRSG